MPTGARLRRVGDPAADHRGDVGVGLPGESPLGRRADHGPVERVVAALRHDAQFGEPLVDLHAGQRPALVGVAGDPQRTLAVDVLVVEGAGYPHHPRQVVDVVDARVDLVGGDGHHPVPTPQQRRGLSGGELLADLPAVDRPVGVAAVAAADGGRRAGAHDGREVADNRLGDIEAGALARRNVEVARQRREPRHISRAAPPAVLPRRPGNRVDAEEDVSGRGESGDVARRFARRHHRGAALPGGGVLAEDRYELAVGVAQRVEQCGEVNGDFGGLGHADHPASSTSL